jgi:hypothetical protein
MDEFRTNPQFNSKLTAILGVILAIVLLYSSYGNLQQAIAYSPLPQQVFLDVYNRPIGEQSLLVPASHNPGFRKTKSLNSGETAADFTKYALLDIFDYNYEDLKNGSVFDKFQNYMYEDVASSLYRDVFANLGHQRIVMSQNGLVRGRFTSALKASSPKIFNYKTNAGVTIEARTFLVEGTFILTAYADKEFPTVYQMKAIVQRALIQDKMMGYQIISLELR